jgi:site-specific DNA-methyltransferase (adenine-specific)
MTPDALFELQPPMRPCVRVEHRHDRDDWETPPELFAALDAEFQFTTDAAAVAATAKCPRYFGPDNPAAPDALRVDWPRGRYFLNPPYSQTGAFIAKADTAARQGSLVVCLVKACTDTRWWHTFVYDRMTGMYRPTVTVRFLKGRVRFVGGKGHAPFPSVIVIFSGA